MTGPQLRAIRESRGLTRDEFADWLGDSAGSTVNKWERDINPVPQWVEEKVLAAVELRLDLKLLQELLDVAREDNLDFPQFLADAIRDRLAKHRAAKTKGATIALGSTLIDEPAEYVAGGSSKGKRKAG